MGILNIVGSSRIIPLRDGQLREVEMAGDTVSLSVATQRVVMGTCDWCTTPDSPLDAIVTVRHSTGVMVRFVACEPCSAAMNRVVTAIGPDAQLSHSALGDSAGRSYPKAVLRPRVRQEPYLETEEVLGEADHLVLDLEGKEYVVRFCGGRRSDGMWIGWLEFARVGTEELLRTGQETSQSDKDGLLYWASGQGPAYFEGAFLRATKVAPGQRI
jgi:hypothetical protein